MVQLIISMDKNGGIGYNNQIPWAYNKELSLIYKQKTMGKSLLVGIQTIGTIPNEGKYGIYCITSDTDAIPNDCDGTIYSFDDLELIVADDDDINWKNNIMIAGGGALFRSALAKEDLVQTVHLSIMKVEECKCDTYIDKNLFKDFVAIERTEYKEFTHYVLERTNNGEYQYLELMKNIITSGEKREGRNGGTVSLFKNDFKFDLRNGFPLLTTKKMFLRGILEEFLFFLRGETYSTILSGKNVRIWEKNTSNEFISSRNLPYANGVLGPMYGYQFRFYNATYNIDMNGRPLTPLQGGIDQIANVVHLIKTDPNSRRILLTAYNPSQAEQGVLYPCHSIIIQFYVQDNFLDMFCYNRSQDLALGIPFNIASSSLLLMVIAKLTKKIPRFFHMTMGDTHIYSEHIDGVSEQLTRIPFKFPILQIPDINNLDDIEYLKASDFILDNYKSHSSIKLEMVA